MHEHQKSAPLGLPDWCVRDARLVFRMQSHWERNYGHRRRRMTCTPCTQDIQKCGDDRQGVRYLHVQAIAGWDFSGMRINGADLINEAAQRTGSL